MAERIADVFVSYKAEDRSRVRHLVKALESEGLDVWWDAQIAGGANWHEDIEEHLDSARCVIVAWTSGSIGHDGHFVRDEARRAQRRGVYLPICLDAVDPPLGFGEIQALPLKGWHGSRTDPRYLEVLAAVRRHVDGVQTVRPRSTRPAIDRRTIVVGGTAAIVAAGAFSGWELSKRGTATRSDSIAVLPFANLSGDPAQAFFSDGIAEEIRSVLTRIPGLKVAGRTSSEVVRNDDAQTAAKKLGVANILAGSVRQSIATIRVTAELIDGNSGLDRWSKGYDRAPGDAIKIQSDIAQNVASSLGATLAQDGRTVGGTDNAQSQRLVIEARAWEHKQPTSKANLLKALQLANTAIAADPKYAKAYARKAIIVSDYAGNFAQSADELRRYHAEALRLAQQALSIGPNLAAAHLALSIAYDGDLQIGPSFAEMKRARQLEPGNADMVAGLGAAFSENADISAALILADEAIALDPLNNFPYYVRLAALFEGRHFQDAVAYGEAVSRRFPDSLDMTPVADSLLLLGRLREAQHYYDTAPAWARLTGEAIIHVRLGDRAGAERKLEQLKAVNGENASTNFAEIYTQLGDKERAFAALERAYAVKDTGLTNLKTDPFLDPLRTDPRFGELLRRLKFPQA